MHVGKAPAPSGRLGGVRLHRTGLINDQLARPLSLLGKTEYRGRRASHAQSREFFLARASFLLESEPATYAPTLGSSKWGSEMRQLRGAGAGVS